MPQPLPCQRSPAPVLSIVVPVLNEAERLPTLLAEMAIVRDRWPRPIEIIVVDGGSEDDSAALAAVAADRVLCSAPGRARQQQTGLRAARGDWVWFVHADASGIARCLRQLLGRLDHPVALWGFFRLRLRPLLPGIRLVAWATHRRSAITGIATGDLGLFVRRQLLLDLGGWPRQSLMEDIELSARLRALGRPLVLAGPLTSSSRRWQRDGIVRTVLGMWWLRLRYWLGADPEALHGAYYPHLALASDERPDYVGDPW